VEEQAHNRRYLTICASGSLHQGYSSRTPCVEAHKKPRRSKGSLILCVDSTKRRSDAPNLMIGLKSGYLQL
jgi:hypothetical protein